MEYCPMKMKVLLSALALSAFIINAQAHVTIRNFANGVDSIAGKSDSFRLNVPTNRGKAVTEVKMVVAEGVKLLFIHPVPGWTYTTEKNDEGNIVSITYKGRMEVGEFTSFPFIALNPKSAVEPVKYKAYVTYEDGVIVPFDGSEEAKGYQPTIQLK